MGRQPTAARAGVEQPTAAAATKPRSNSDDSPSDLQLGAPELSDWDARYHEAGAGLDDEARQARAAELLAEMSLRDTATQPPTLTRLTALTSTPSGKLIVIVAGTAVLLTLGLLCMWIVGLVL